MQSTPLMAFDQHAATTLAAVSRGAVAQRRAWVMARVRRAANPNSPSSPRWLANSPGFFGRPWST